ncbi:MAG: DUF1127 domain-containing protein [Alphaproteobacteria bacterium]|nr:DUF1127 domain-containing protein [Alphaproteobacteria bacterium]
MTTIETAFTTSINNSGLFATLTRLAGEVGNWLERVQQRQQLAELDERVLQDIGVSRTATPGRKSASPSGAPSPDLGRDPV